MAFQSTVPVLLAFGYIGDLITDGPQRAEVLTLDNNGGVIGRYFTKSAVTGIATQGGTIGATVTGAGFLVNSKVYASYGTTAGTLAPTLTLPGNTNGEFLTMGTFVATVTGAANIGDKIQYSTTDGTLTAIAPTAAFTASQTTTVLTVTAITAGNLGVGTDVYAAGVLVGQIISLGTGTGGAGTYNLNTTGTVASGPMTAASVAVTGSAFVPNAVVYHFPTSATGSIAIRVTN